MDKNKQQQKKKKKGGIGWLIFLAVIWGINRLDVEGVSRFFQRLRWQFRTGRFNWNSNAAIMAIAVVIALVAAVVAVSAVAKAAREKRFDGVKTRRSASAASPMSGQRVQHSHDRLSGYHGEESGFDHWKKQLDGFLEAGIIDRSEYRVLLERRRK